MKTTAYKLIIVCVLVLGVVWPAFGSSGFSEQVVDDWVVQNRLRSGGLYWGNDKLTVESDAAGGCDGVVDGGWGFHTLNEDQPWWVVDLGESVEIGRVVIYNRKELGSRNERIIVLVSDDGEKFKRVYQHNGQAFLGFADGKPLVIEPGNIKGRFVKLQLPGKSYFHLDEVEIYPKDSDENIALRKSATQSSISQWSKNNLVSQNKYPVAETIAQGMVLAEKLRVSDVDVAVDVERLNGIADESKNTESDESKEKLYLSARRAIRKLALKNPLLDFDRILFVKRAPGIFPHMSDQYYGWWSRGGGGIYILEDFKTDNPKTICLTENFAEGNFLRPELSYDGEKVLFAYCRYYKHVADMEKVDKDKLPEDSFYSIYEMEIDSGKCRRLTCGRYDDFDARYLPDGDIVFLSTRKGTALQVGKASAEATSADTMADSYARCGGDNKRPCAVFTLHAMDGDGKGMRAISAFENFEWTPAIANDGRIIYARWDYIDRFNGHFMSLWSTMQDGTNAQLVYGNYTKKPQCIFEARPIPNSNKLVFTAAAHHSNMGGSIVLLDRTKGTEFEEPLTRLTPEVPFPETEEWKDMYYANPWPLSEEFFLVAWSDKRLPPHSRVEDNERNPSNAMGIYIYDAFGNLELLHRDPAISSMYPIPVKARRRPPVHGSAIEWAGKQQGQFLVQDIYQGLDGVERGTVKSLRVIGVVPKVQPHMNRPVLGVSKEEPGKFILGTVPVEEDGSAYFRVPSGVSFFFQALDGNGMAVQTMRSLTYVQPNQTLSCIGCHETRDSAPAGGAMPMALVDGPSKIKPGPGGSWPLRFDKLVGPVLERSCVSCHSDKGDNEIASKFDLSDAKAYNSLLAFGDKDIEKLAFEKDRSEIGDCAARKSKLLKMLTEKGGHYDVELTADDLGRLITWLDTYAQRLGSFSDEQEKELIELRDQHADIFADAEAMQETISKK